MQPLPSADRPSPHVLRPWNAREAITVTEAAGIAGRSVAHMRRLVDLHDLGRRVGGGHWRVSKVALRMFLDSDHAALDAYRAGRRDDPAVRSYFAEAGLCPDRK